MGSGLTLCRHLDVSEMPSVRPPPSVPIVLFKCPPLLTALVWDSQMLTNLFLRDADFNGKLQDMAQGFGDHLKGLLKVNKVNP